MTVSADKGRAKITEAINQLKEVRSESSTSVVLPIFSDSKLDEVINIYSKAPQQEKEDIYKIVIAAKELSNEKTGGLIVIERDIQINDIMDTGVRIGADVSPQLLVNLFVPKTPLHDGAVVISKNKIEAAACILPLADDKELATGLGTRHRAAIGISRETDAIAVVISEETGKISVARDGTLIADVKEETLKKILMKNIVTDKFGTDKKDHKIRVWGKKRVKVQKNNNPKNEETENTESKEEKN